MEVFLACDPTQFATSKDAAQDPRWIDRVNWQEPEACTHVLIGYPDDRGVSYNGGRAGAAGGPEAIRKIFYKTTPSPKTNSEMIKLWDKGDLSLSDNLRSDHDRAVEALQREFTNRASLRIVSMGGGHDFAYCDGRFFLSRQRKHQAMPVIINFDAHLDCRPMQEQPHSGTPFYRLLQEFPGQFLFIEVGLQEQCNARSHYEWASGKGLKSLWLEDILRHPDGLYGLWQDRFQTELSVARDCFVSVDLDAFSSAIAPGCSQSWPSGLAYADFARVMGDIQRAWHVQNLGVYELAPNLDSDQRTARLAAKILHEFIR